MSHPTSSRPVADSALSRRSIRKYTDADIPDADIWEILNLASRAPSTMNMQPWRFVAVKDRETRQKLMAVGMNQPQIGSAPVVIVLYSDFKDAVGRPDDWIHPNFQGEERDKRRAQIVGAFGGMEPTNGEWLARSQANIALGYLLLVLESLGYGSSPMLGFDPAGVKALLGLPEHVMISALVAFGIPAEEGHTSIRIPTEKIGRIV